MTGLCTRQGFLSAVGTEDRINQWSCELPVWQDVSGIDMLKTVSLDC